jgi:Fe-S oxidoreductase
MFHPEKCDECGKCFTQCHYIDYSQKQAIEEIRALKVGNNANILKKCITCMACNEYCTKGANPYDLIVQLQEEKHIRLVPEEKVAFIERTLTGVLNELVEGEPGKPVLNLCVMEYAFPSNMTEGKLFEGLTKIKGSDYFSRIVYLHTGMESQIREHAQSYIDNLAHLNNKEIIFVHDDCYTMAAKKAPEYGIAVPFKPISIIEYMASYLKNNKDAITSLKKKIAYQRPCIARYSPELEAFLDEFFNLAGVERIARKYDRSNALCCGIGLREPDPERASKILQRNLNDAQHNGAEAMVFSCPSCFCFMSQQCEERGLASIFITDLCRMALGELPFSSRPWRGP